MEQKKVNLSFPNHKSVHASKPKHKNTTTTSKHSNILKFSLYKNLPFFSYKILEAKHSTNPELYQQILMNNLILGKKSHFGAYLNEVQLNTNVFRELLKRLYSYQESKERIPKYVSYYQNYLKFFCRPVFGDYVSNKKMVKHMEKVAQIFYNENYAEEDEAENMNRSHKQKFNFKVFNKTVREEIDNIGNYTKVDINTNESKSYEDMKSKTIDVNKRCFLLKKNDLDLLENVYKITPILINNKANRYKNKKTIKNSKEKIEKDDSNNSTTEYNSFKKIIKIMESKKNKKKEKEASHKKNTNNNNKVSSNQNSNIFDYFNSLSSILFSKKKKTFLNKNKNNSVNNKMSKKKEKNLYNLSNNNKIINNINININHLTIGQKSINPISELNSNCTFKKYKKRNAKMRKNNSMILKDKSFKNYINCFGNLTSKNIESKKRNNSFKFPVNGVIGYNSNKYKKVKSINFTSNINNIKNLRNKSNIRRSQRNNGYITSLHKISNKRKDSSRKKFGKISICTNNNLSNYIKNMHKILDISNNSKKIKHSNYNSNSNNFSNKNINSFYKISSSISLSPLVWNINKRNISMNKGASYIISYDRIRSTSNKNKKNNKIFSSGFNFNLGSKNGANCRHNFISPTNNIMIYQKSKLKLNNKKENHDRNISSPIYRENIPIINKNNLAINKKKIKDEQIFSYSKIINLKFKNLVKLSNLKKNLKISKKSRNKSKSKGKNNSKK